MSQKRRQVLRFVVPFPRTNREERQVGGIRPSPGETILMILDQVDKPRAVVGSTSSPAASADTLKFGNNDGFQTEVRRRVDDYFRRTGRRQRDCPKMYLKTALIFAWLLGSYVLLVFMATAWWQCLLLAVSVGLAVSGVGFSVQHDGGHHGYSNYSWINKLAAMSLDLIGGSSYLWHWKHAVFHHTFVNVTGHDSDIDLGNLARLTPHQKRLGFHRFQHFYLWPLYGFLSIKWQLLDDFHDAIVGHICGRRIPRPKGWDLVVFLGGKLLFLSLIFVIPMLFNPVWAVLLLFGVVSVVVGVTLSVVFQLAHCVGEADFPMPEAATGRIEQAWAVHQVETTVNFSRRSKLICWFVGGLNFQIEHHLFPRICHVNYPAISKVVEETCREFGVRYVDHGSFGAGVASHYRWLRQMGTED